MKFTDHFFHLWAALGPVSKWGRVYSGSLHGVCQEALMLRVQRSWETTAPLSYASPFSIPRLPPLLAELRPHS